MSTSHHPCWDAKNRYDLPEICDFDYQVIKGILEDGSQKAEKKAPAPNEQKERSASQTARKAGTESRREFYEHSAGSG